jgi:diguanylate cyclase (GGDEF)-like protein
VKVKSDLVTVTASFGAADAVGMGSAEALIKQADEALYRAKRAGRNRVEGCDVAIEYREKDGVRK